MIELSTSTCPVCSGRLEEHTGWAVRRSGQWLRFRTQQCLAEFERQPEAYPEVDRGPEESPCSEWAWY